MISKGSASFAANQRNVAFKIELRLSSSSSSSHEVLVWETGLSGG
jgi:hypothetical protein